MTVSPKTTLWLPKLYSYIPGATDAGLAAINNAPIVGGRQQFTL